DGSEGAEGAPDVLQALQSQAIERLRNEPGFKDSVERLGVPYGVVVGKLKDALPLDLDDRDSFAYRLVPRAMEAIYGGPQGTTWDTERRPTKAGKQVTFIVKK